MSDSKLTKSLQRYQALYLNKNYTNLSESSTRIVVNHLLSDVLGYRELAEIKTEYAVTGGFADYVIEINHKKHFVIEVKRSDMNLSSKHLRQATYYAVTIGADWIMLTNGRYLELYKLTYSKPVKVTKIFNLDLKKHDDSSKYLLGFITKQSLLRGELKNLAMVRKDLVI